MNDAGKAIVIDTRDNVATLLCDAKKGMIVCAKSDEKEVELEIQKDIAFGHKVALYDIEKNEPIYKYGEIIGQAAKDIKKGEHVHIHNVDSLRGLADK